MILYFLAAVVVLGGATIIWSLNDLRAGNIMFDGGSICESSINVWLLSLVYQTFTNVINHFVAL